MVLLLLSTAPVDFPQASPSVISSHHGTKIAPSQQTSLPVDNENVPYFPKTTYQNYKSLFYYLDCRALICSSSDLLAFTLLEVTFLYILAFQFFPHPLLTNSLT